MFNSPHSLVKLFEPRSIAIVGASREPSKLGNIIISNLQTNHFAGVLYPINPHAKKIKGLKCYARYSDLPKAPDLAIIAVPADIVLEIIPEIAQRGTRHLVILSAGFKEIGAEGVAREKKLLALAHRHNCAILGPNCLGFINNNRSLNATFGQASNLLGNVRYLSQSGAIATSIFDAAVASKVGFSECITLGNKTIIDENDVLDYWLNHKKISPNYDTTGLSKHRPIGMYLESISDGKRFVELARQLSQKDPVFILKPGKSVAAQAAMQSHTGALANDDVVLGAALATAGVVRCSGVEDFFDLAKVFAWENAPFGPRVAIVSNAGGPAVITTDALAEHGLSVATLSAKTQAILHQTLPRAANVHNPVDVLGDALADRYETALKAVLLEKKVDAVIIILTPQVMTQIEKTAKIIGRLSKIYKKPIVCSFMGGSAVEVGESVLNNFRIPSYRFPERAVRALGALWQWRQSQNSPSTLRRVTGLLSPAVEHRLHNLLGRYKGLSDVSTVPPVQAQQFSAIAGINTVPSALITGCTFAEHQAERWGYPVVLKISSAKLLHKTESNGVITGIRTPSELRSAFEKIEKVADKIGDPEINFELQKQITDGIEVVVGLKRDPNFGLVCLLGAGGIFTNLIEDRNIMLATNSASEIRSAIERSKIGRILLGFRGDQPYAVDKLIAMIQRLALIGKTFDKISVMEINPVIVSHHDAFAVDTKIILKS